MKANTRRVMKQAHLIYKDMLMKSIISDIRADWGAAVRTAWRLYYLRRAMLEGAVRVYYLNQHGQYCSRTGTLCMRYIPGASMPKGILAQEIASGLSEPVWSTFNYYDLDKQGWRSFCITDLMRAERVTIKILCDIESEDELFEFYTDNIISQR